MNSRTVYNWKCRDRTLRLGERTLVMGILNVTPDSFSDGGIYSDTDIAVKRALEMVEEGADIIDIGGESTRPGADAVCAADEIKRTIPVIKEIRRQSDIPISIDTTKSAVALAAVEAGADIVNDVSAFEVDNSMGTVVSQTGAGIILMHMKGTPKTMQKNPAYGNVVTEIRNYLVSRMDYATRFGIKGDAMVVDPGIGFGKTVAHNLALLRGLPELSSCGSPILVGASRKRFIGQIVQRDRATDRRAGSLGVAAWLVSHGVHILRVHDVIETCDVCRIMDTLVSGDM